ncbi:hypothetical protein BN173_2420013 [Clostridioides difficile T11]|nr:hypothetical protein BN173_2420013 [Clostridioides difficile T11]CCL30841.1 hypothetical protein BN174_2160013 [Clostridioides difficile E15]
MYYIIFESITSKKRDFESIKLNTRIVELMITTSYYKLVLVS